MTKNGQNSTCYPVHGYLQDLAKTEKEIFGSKFAPDGSLVLQQPKYWNSNKDGKASGYLRLAP
jgi:hypothetical protein